MIRALFYKELLDHVWHTVVIYCLMGVLASIIFIAGMLQSPPVTWLQNLPRFLFLGCMLVSWFVGFRLFTREYTGKTQLFLETLPLSRSAFIVFKWVLGWFIAVSFPLFVSALAIYHASLHQEIAPSFVLTVLCRVLCFATFIWALFALFSMGGRYRFALAFLALTMMIVLGQYTDIEFSRSVPLALVSETLPVDPILPVPQIFITLVASVLLLFITGAVSVVREGSVAAMLAQRMSHREKVLIVAMFICTFFAMFLLDERKTLEPLAFADSSEIEEAGVHLRIRPGRDDDPAQIMDFAQQLHAELVDLRKMLEIKELMTTSITIRRDLDPNIYQKANVTGATGLLISINPAGDQWDSERFLGWLIREIVSDQGHGRPAMEHQSWLLDGLGPYFIHRKISEDALEAIPVLHARALYGVEAGLREEWLDEWYRYRESVGPEIAQAVAWSGLSVLAQHAGTEAVRMLLCDTIGRETPEDFRAALHDWLNPVEEKLLEHTGLDRTAFVDLWRKTLRDSTSKHLRSVPRLRASLVVRNDVEGRTRPVWTLAPNSGLTPDSRINFKYVELGALGKLLKPEDVQSTEVLLDAALEGVEIPGIWHPSDRLAWTAAIYDESFKCEVISGWQRTHLAP